MTATEAPIVDTAGLYSIGAVSRLTGISTHTLRIWERRYGAVIAERTASGRRMYDRRQIEKLGLLKTLSDHGFSIGQIANLPLEELRRRRAEVAERQAKLRAESRPEPLRVAALGRFYLDTLAADSFPDDLELVTLETDPDRYRVDLPRLAPDVLLIELTVVKKDTAERVAALRERSGATRAVVLYNYGQRADLMLLVSAGVELLRSPATRETLYETLRIPGPPPALPLTGGVAREAPALDVLAEVPPRRYSEQELSRIARLESSLDCECPLHLTGLVQGLVAFELYSEECEARSPDDAALHTYLGAMAGRARAVVEEALATLIAAEELEV